MKNKIRDKYTGGKPFFLFVGLVHPRKNLYRTIEAFNQFKNTSGPGIKLLIVGSTKYMTADVKKAWENSPYKSEIIFCGRLPDNELKMVTASALAQVYVSLFEGFGIPILEAMACETPVITSQTSSMPEVGGNSVLYADPYSIGSICEAMLRIFNDDALRERLIINSRAQREKFSWDKTSDLVWKSIEKVY
jgi:glycosyltransferase involved in cell wall biosynthesis